MIKFDDKEIQKAFNECHFRQKYGDVDICRGMCQPCDRTIEKGQCAMIERPNVFEEIYVPTEEEFVSAEKYTIGRATFTEESARNTYHKLIEQKCYGDIWAVVYNARCSKDNRVSNKCCKCIHYKGNDMEDEFDICDNLSRVMMVILCDFVETEETDTEQYLTKEDYEYNKKKHRWGIKNDT